MNTVKATLEKFLIVAGNLIVLAFLVPIGLIAVLAMGTKELWKWVKAGDRLT